MPQGQAITRIPAQGEHLLEDTGEDHLPVASLETTSLSLCKVHVSRELCLYHMPRSFIL